MAARSYPSRKNQASTEPYPFSLTPTYHTSSSFLLPTDGQHRAPTTPIGAAPLPAYIPADPAVRSGPSPASLPVRCAPHAATHWSGRGRLRHPVGPTTPFPCTSPVRSRLLNLLRCAALPARILLSTTRPITPCSTRRRGPPHPSPVRRCELLRPRPTTRGWSRKTPSAPESRGRQMIYC